MIGTVGGLVAGIGLGVIGMALSGYHFTKGGDNFDGALPPAGAAPPGGMMGGPPGGGMMGGPPGGGMMQIGILVAIFALFYFMLIRPQTKRAKEHREMVAKLAAGDEVVTNGGVLGRISEVGEHFVTLQVSSGVAIQVQKFQVAQLMPKGTFKGA